MYGKAEAVSTLYWDPAGTQTILSTTTFTWDLTSLNWTAAALGNPGTTGSTTWVPGSQAFFSAPQSGSNNSNIFVSGNEVADNLFFQYGTESFSGVAGSSTITLANGFSASGNQTTQNVTFANTVSLVATQSQQWIYQSGQSRAFTMSSPVSSTTIAGGVVTVVPFNNTAASPYSLNGPISDGAAGGRLMLERIGGPGVVTINGTNSYSGGTIVDGSILSIGTAGNLGTGTVLIGTGALRLGATGNYSTNTNITTSGFYVGPLAGLTTSSTGVVPLFSTIVNPSSSGYIGLEATIPNSINLSTIGNGSMFLGSTSAGAFSGAAGALTPGTGNTYRLGAGGGTLTVSGAGVLSGANSVTVGLPTANIIGSLGSGTAKVTTSQTYTGGTIVNLGSTAEGSALASGSAFGASTGSITLNGGRIQLDGIVATATSTTVGDLNFNGTGSILVNTTSPTAVTTLTIGGTNGLVRQNNGVLQIGVTGTSNVLGTNSIVTTTNNAPAPVTTSSGTMIPAYFIDSTGTFLTYNAATGFTDAVSGPSTLGAATAASGNDYVKTTTTDATGPGSGVTQTIYALTAGGTLTGGGGTLNITSGGLGIIAGSIGSATAASNINLNFGSAEALIYNPAASTIFSPISGSGGLTKFGAGNLTLNPTGTNTFTGAVTIDGGALTAVSDAALGGSSGVNVNGAEFIFGGSTTFTTTRGFNIGSNGGSFSTATSGVTATLNGAITTSTGAPAPALYFTSVNVNRYNLGNVGNTFTAPIFVENRAILAITDDADLGNTANAITLNALDSFSTAGSPVLLAASSVTTSRNITLTGSIQVGDTLDSSGASGLFTLNGVISGDSLLNVQSSATGNTGIIKLTGSNTYFGGTTLKSGKLIVASPTALGTSTVNPLTLSGGTIDLATDTSVTAYNTVVTANAAIASDKATPGSSGITQTLGDLTFTGASTLTTTAGTNVTGGTPAVSFSGPTILSNTTGGISSRLNPVGASIALASVTSLAPTGKTNTLSLDGTMAGNSISGAITDNGGITGTMALSKTNTSTWTLLGSSTYSGGTTVSAGTLFANNNSGSGTGSGSVILSGGTFGGTGTASGTITVNTTATLEAGIGAANGTLTTGSITFSGGTFLAAINSTAGTSDSLSSPSVSLGTTTQLTLTDVSPGTAGTTRFVIVASTTPVTGNFAGLADGAAVSVGGNAYTINYNTAIADDVTLSPAGAPVPEPASIALLSIGGLGLLRRRRRV